MTGRAFGAKTFGLVGERGADWTACDSASWTSPSSSGSGCSTDSTGSWRARRSWATRPFFASRDFLWSSGLEAHWATIRAELDAVLEHRDALPNFQDISTDQESITDDDRWKTFFLYGFGFRSDTNCALLPGDRQARRVDPGDEDGDVLDPGPAQAHPGSLRALQGHRAVPPRAEGARAPRPVPHPGRRRDRDVGRGSEPHLRRHLRARGLERHRR